LLGNDTAAPDTGETLVVASVSNPVGGTVVRNADGSVTFTPAPNFNGAASFDYVVNDGTPGSDDTGHVTFNVTAVNDGPAAGDDALSAVAEDSGPRAIAAAALLANDSGAPDSNETLVIASVSNPVGGTAVRNADGSVTFTPAANFNGAASFDYVVNDGTPGSNDTGHVSFSVTAVNDAPTVGVPVKLPAVEANSGAHLITQTQLLGNANDVDGPPLSAINLQIAAGQGTLADHHDGSWSHTPASNDDTGVTFSFSVTDGVAAPVADTATLDIVPAQAVPQTGSPGDDTFTAVTGNAQYDAGLGVDTITFGFKLTEATVSYDGNKVIIDGPSSHTVLTGFEIYKFTDGTVNNHDSDVPVDDLYYYSHNNDVWLAGADADAHYHATGWHEGRDPDAFFSTSTYLSMNQDVKAAGVDPLLQYDHAGWKTGADPSIAFDTNAYLAANPDVKAAGADPLEHFLSNGYQESRQPIAPTVLLAANGFDYVYYLQHNPDVAAAHADPFQHFETTGWKEGRNPNADFDTKGYLAAYGDVAAAGINPLDHYNQAGWKEGRDPSPNFDTTDYLSHYADVANAHINPLIHFLQYGQAEGRSPFADGHFG
jgi:hypothetical protein